MELFGDLPHAQPFHFIKMSDLIAKDRIHGSSPLGSSLEHLFDFFEIGSSNLLFPLGPFFSGGQDHGAKGQRENLIERRLIGHQRSQDQPLSGRPRVARSIFRRLAIRSS